MKTKESASTKLVILLILLSALILALAACGIFNGGDETDPDGGGDKKPVSVTVTLDPNGGSGVTKLTLIGEAGSAMELPSPARAGCTFDKWYADWSLISQTEFPSSNTVLTARYYADEDIPQVLNLSTAAGTEYTSTFTWSVSSSWTAEDRTKAAYIQRTPNLPLTLDISFEGRATISTSYVSWAIYGSTDGDRLYFDSDSNLGGQYKTIAFTIDTASNTLSGQGRLLAFKKDNDVAHCSYRNFNIDISFVLKAGTLV
ncbi:MAG: InlB B-repeat-containing protein [Clostridiales bacterium]|jgi:hypothetical protein|nr:InlB B-repeat-containing protein [Clostridiales bacterium]